MNRRPRIAIAGVITPADVLKTSAEWESISLRAALVLSNLAIDLSLVAIVSGSTGAVDFADRLADLGLATPTIIRSEQAGSAVALPIDEMFSADCCVLDLSELTRVRFLVNLPVHTWPGARLVCGLDRIADGDSVIVREICERIDAVAGSIASAMQITLSATPELALETLQAWMLTANLKLALVELENGVLCAITRSDLLSVVVESNSVHAPFSLPALLAAVAVSLATRSGPAETLDLAKAFLAEMEGLQGH